MCIDYEMKSIKLSSHLMITWH